MELPANRLGRERRAGQAVIGDDDPVSLAAMDTLLRVMTLICVAIPIALLIIAPGTVRRALPSPR